MNDPYMVVRHPEWTFLSDGRTERGRISVVVDCNEFRSPMIGIYMSS